jgi:hypothetical protein
MDIQCIIVARNLFHHLYHPPPKLYAYRHLYKRTRGLSTPNVFVVRLNMWFNLEVDPALSMAHVIVDLSWQFSLIIFIFVDQWLST